MNEKSAQPQKPDIDLLHEFARGNADAFEIFYDRHHASIFNYLLRLTGEQSAAEELLQEAFMAAWKSARRFKGRSTVKTWLFRIAHHQAVSWLRKNRRDQQPLLIEAEIPEAIPGGEASPEEFSFQSWQADQIILALEKLSENHRAVIELTFVQEFSVAEIASIMDCPQGTVKSRLSYALRHLSGILQQMGLDNGLVG